MNDLKLTKSVYSIDNIQKAILAYRRLAQIRLNETKNDWYLSFHKCLVDKKKTMDEFENYLIELENISSFVNGMLRRGASSDSEML